MADTDAKISWGWSHVKDQVAEPGNPLYRFSWLMGLQILLSLFYIVFGAIELLNYSTYAATDEDEPQNAKFRTHVDALTCENVLYLNKGEGPVTILYVASVGMVMILTYTAVLLGQGVYNQLLGIITFRKKKPLKFGILYTLISGYLPTYAAYRSKPCDYISIDATFLTPMIFTYATLLIFMLLRLFRCFKQSLFTGIIRVCCVAALVSQVIAKAAIPNWSLVFDFSDITMFTILQIVAACDIVISALIDLGVFLGERSASISVDPSTSRSYQMRDIDV